MLAGQLFYADTQGLMMFTPEMAGTTTLTVLRFALTRAYTPHTCTQLTLIPNFGLPSSYTRHNIPPDTDSEASGAWYTYTAQLLELER